MLAERLYIETDIREYHECSGQQLGWKANHIYNGCHCIRYGRGEDTENLEFTSAMTSTWVRDPITGGLAMTSTDPKSVVNATQYDVVRCYSMILEQLNLSIESCICVTVFREGAR